MKIRLFISFFILLGVIFATTPLFAEDWLPDPNLRIVIRETLQEEIGLPDLAPLTKEHLKQLTNLEAANRYISDITGLEYAVNLWRLSLLRNQIVDITPLENLTSLNTLHLGINQIVDITPLENLTELVELSLDSNRIVDIMPLNNLKHLVQISLQNNPIQDLTPLLSLPSLEYLNVEGVLIEDIAPFLDLHLIEFKYDLLCKVFGSPAIPVEERISTRMFPSVFQATSPIWVEGMPLWDRDTDPELIPLHDLLFSGLIHYEDLYFQKSTLGADLILKNGRAQELHAYYHARNPNFVSLYWWEFISWKPGGALFPEESRYWMTDREGNRVCLGSQCYLNIIDPEVQEILINQGVAIAQCGIFDGVMIDNFAGGPGRIISIEDRDSLKASSEEIEAAVIHIFSEIRARVPDDFIIVVNAGANKMESLLGLINGSFIEHVREPGRYYSYKDLSILENALQWNEANLRYPQVNGLEGTGIEIEHPNSPNNQKWMRVLTALTLTHSDSYVVYSTGRFESHFDTEKGHYWYDFYDADLGRPIGGDETKGQRYDNHEGVFIREFTNGWAVYNRSGQEQAIELPEEVSGVASGITGHSHVLADLDGEIYLKAETPPVADVNGDGVVNIQDLVIVANAFGEAEPDLNSDGVVNIQDLVIVANAF